jgi:uncharacterized damage-inducible protein DinB
METQIDMARRALADARRMFNENTRALTLDEALSTASGYRSILGVMKHIGGWVHVYRSFAYDAEPVHWRKTSWPRGLRDTVEPADEYVREVAAWVDEGLGAWDVALEGVDDDELSRPHKLHWGGTAPLGEIATYVAHHVVYHTGELNMLLSIARGEAWEYTEEVEENHISTLGHGVRPGWMDDTQAQGYEAMLRAAAEARRGQGG